MEKLIVISDKKVFIKKMSNILVCMEASFLNHVIGFIHFKAFNSKLSTIWKGRINTHETHFNIKRTNELSFMLGISTHPCA